MAIQGEGLGGVDGEPSPASARGGRELAPPPDAAAEPQAQIRARISMGLEPELVVAAARLIVTASSEVISYQKSQPWPKLVATPLSSMASTTT